MEAAAIESEMESPDHAVAGQGQSRRWIVAVDQKCEGARKEASGRGASPDASPCLMLMRPISRDDAKPNEIGERGSQIDFEQFFSRLWRGGPSNRLCPWGAGGGLDDDRRTYRTSEGHGRLRPFPRQSRRFRISRYSASEIRHFAP